MKKVYFIQTLIALCFATIAFGQKPLSIGEHFADINGIKIHYYVSGKGPVCLFPTPGWGPSIGGYVKSLKPFEKYFTMVWYDTRISGQSTGPTDSTKYASKDFMSDMDALRIYLKQKKVWIAGHSMGGFQVLNYGIHHSDKLNGIIAIAAMVGRDSLYMTEMNKMMMKRKDQPYFQKGYDIFYGKDTSDNSLNGTMQFILPFYFHDTNNIAKFTPFMTEHLSEKAWKYTDVSKFGSEYLFPNLNKIKVPTLAVVGDDDFICDKISQSDRITKHIPQATEIVIKDAGHFSWVEQPDQFFADIEKWLKKQGLKERK